MDLTSFTSRLTFYRKSRVFWSLRPTTTHCVCSFIPPTTAMAANSEVKGGGVHEPKAQTAGSCTGFLSMKLPKSTATPLPRRDASRSQVYIPPPPPAVRRRYPFIHLGEERQSGVKFLVYGSNATA